MGPSWTTSSRKADSEDGESGDGAAGEFQEGDGEGYCMGVGAGWSLFTEECKTFTLKFMMWERDQKWALAGEMQGRGRSPTDHWMSGWGKERRILGPLETRGLRWGARAGSLEMCWA